MRNYLEDMLFRYPKLSSVQAEVQDAFDLLCRSILRSNKILTCGNGGSAADAEHIVGELMKGFHLKRCLTPAHRQEIRKFFPEEADILSNNLQLAVPAISLVGSISLSTAFSNDMSPDYVFAQQVYGLGVPGDVLIAISTSGESVNVVNAAKIARIKGLKVLALTGEKGGELERCSDITIHAPSLDTAEIQELHLPIYHCICSMLEDRLFADEPEE